MRFVTRLSVLACVFALFALIPATALAAPPANDIPPSIEADPLIVGVQASAEPGMWTPPPINSEMRWQLCETTDESSCADIEGAVGETYYPTDEQGGKYLRVIETAYNELDESNTAASAISGPIRFSPEVIDNGILALGLRNSGSLNVDTEISSYHDTSTFGLRLLDGQYDAIAQGSPAEGWGLADQDTAITGWANRDFGDSNANVVSYSNDGQEATSVVELRDGSDNPYARITHDFAPSTDSQFLYEADVTIEPLALTGMSHALYRRAVDWDVEPTEYNEVVSTVIGNAANLKGVSDDGFTSTNPLSELSYNNQPGEVFSNGPDDIGAAFDFDFGAIPYGSTRQFKMFYGAAPTRDQLLGALEDAGVETFSIASNSSEEGYATGGPAIFALGFSQVGGDPVIDSTAPVATIQSAPAARTNHTTAQFTFDASEPGSSFECRLDDGSWNTCTSPASYSDLSLDDQHKFLVRASKDGKTQALPTIHAWRVTTRPFDLYFEASPEWWGPNTSADFFIEADEADIADLDLTCSLDGAAFAACGQSESFVGLATGEHTFDVIATMGDVSETLSYTWTISSEVMSRFDDRPDSLSSSPLPYFGWQVAGDVAGVQCKLDAGNWYECGGGNSTNLSVLDGEHTFSIRAYDAADNFQGSPTSWTWTKDTLDPTITHNFPTVLGTDSFNAEITASEPLDYLVCRIDSQPWVDCSGGMALTGLADGEHEFSIEGEDLAGNETSVEFGFYVDAGASVAKFTATPPWATTSRAASFSFTADPGSTFECSIDEATFTACSSPATFDLLAFDESHVFAVRATKNGRTQAAPTFYRWRITDAPFDLYFDSRPSKLTTDTDAYFEVEADNFDDDQLSYQCSLDGSALAACPNPFIFENLATGTHKVTVRASDGIASEVASYEWRVFANGTPAVLLGSVPGKRTASDSANFTWWTGGPVDQVRCRLDDGSLLPCDAPTSHSLSGLTEGTHTFDVVPYDSGNVPGEGDSFTWTVDQTAPVVSTSGVPASFSLPYELPLSANEDISRLDCMIDGQSYEDCGFPVKLTYLSLGSHTLEFVARDLAGNESAPQSLVFTVVAPPSGGGTPPPAPTPVTPAKPGVSLTKPKAKAKKIKLQVTCPVAKCSVSGWVKVGKKKYKLKSQSVKQGKQTVTLKFSKSLAKATKKAKKGKTSWSISVVGDGQKTSKSGKF